MMVRIRKQRQISVRTMAACATTPSVLAVALAMFAAEAAVEAAAANALLHNQARSLLNELVGYTMSCYCKTNFTHEDIEAPALWFLVDEISDMFTLDAFSQEQRLSYYLMMKEFVSGNVCDATPSINILIECLDTVK